MTGDRPPAPGPSGIDEALRLVPLFAQLGSGDFAAMRREMRMVRLADGQCLFQQDDAAEWFYYLRSGCIKLCRLSHDGQEKVLEIIQPGATFAEAIMFLEERIYPVSAVAVGVSRVVACSSRAYVEVLRRNPDYCLVLLGQMSRWLHRQIIEIDRLTLKSAVSRLASFLLQHVGGEESAPVTIELTVPKRVIASRLSIQPETFSRLLQQLAKQGLLTVREHRIELHDVARLQEWAEREDNGCERCPRRVPAQAFTSSPPPREPPK